MVNDAQLPLGPPGEHFLNQISQHGMFKTKLAGVSARTTGGDLQKRPLYVVVNVTEVHNIDPTDDAFSIRMRLYLLWSVDFDAESELHDFRKYRDRACQMGHYYSLKQEEVTEVESEITLHVISFANADSVEVRHYASINESRAS